MEKPKETFWPTQYFLVHAKWLQSCLTLCDPMDCSLPVSFVHGIFQARIQEWVPCPPPGDLSNTGIKPLPLSSPALSCRFFITRITWEAQYFLTWSYISSILPHWIHPLDPSLILPLPLFLTKGPPFSSCYLCMWSSPQLVHKQLGERNQALPLLASPKVYKTISYNLCSQFRSWGSDFERQHTLFLFNTRYAVDPRFCWTCHSVFVWPFQSLLFKLYRELRDDIKQMTF